MNEGFGAFRGISGCLPDYLIPSGRFLSRKAVLSFYPSRNTLSACTCLLLLLAEMLQDYRGKLGIEIVAFNGEDYYSAGEQMDYLHQ